MILEACEDGAAFGVMNRIISRSIFMTCLETRCAYWKYLFSQKVNQQMLEIDRRLPTGSLDGLLSGSPFLLLLAIDSHHRGGDTNCKRKNGVRSAGDDVRRRSHDELSFWMLLCIGY